MDPKELYDALYKPFSPEAERTLTKSGTRLTYIPQAEVVTRLNQVFGVEGWSSQILSMFRDPADQDWIVAHVRITASIPNALGGFSTVTRDGVGGQAIKRTKKEGTIVDLGDEFKGAVSDALKKAASQLGVGLYLARDEDAIDAESMQDAPPPRPQVDPIVQKGWDGLLDVSKNFTTEEKDQIKAEWKRLTNNDGRPMNLSNMTPEFVDALATVATDIAFKK